jgi:predicted dehydrogenase
MNKICLIGYGYWGKILLNNFKSMGYDEITIVDESLNNINLIDDTFSHYIIATPFSTHKYFLEKIGKFKNKKIWCEKPLVELYDESVQIYKLMEINNNMLFVDWVYTFNPCVIHLKNILGDKKLKQIIINSFTLGIVEIMVHLYG